MTTTKKARPAPWSAAENLALARLYFDMLNCAIWDRPYNKAAMIREVQGNDVPGEAGALIERGRGSVEAKLMNASAAHAAIDSEAVTMDGYGYRALANYQASLKDAIAAELHRRDPHFILDHLEASA